jgi:hypothetical protein
MLKLFYLNFFIVSLVTTFNVAYAGNDYVPRVYPPDNELLRIVNSKLKNAFKKMKVKQKILEAHRFGRVDVLGFGDSFLFTIGDSPAYEAKLGGDIEEIKELSPSKLFVNTSWTGDEEWQIEANVIEIFDGKIRTIHLFSTHGGSIKSPSIFSNEKVTVEFRMEDYSGGSVNITIDPALMKSAKNSGCQSSYKDDDPWDCPDCGTISLDLNLSNEIELKKCTLHIKKVSAEPVDQVNTKLNKAKPAQVIPKDSPEAIVYSPTPELKQQRVIDPFKCKDSDSGFDETIAGVMIVEGLPASVDKCLGDALAEYACPNSMLTYFCAVGCKNGACIKDAELKCFDGDPSQDFSKKSIVTLYKGDAVLKTLPDTCGKYNGKPDQYDLIKSCNGTDCAVIDYNCSPHGNASMTSKPCQSGCNDGICK